ncbi:MAG: hypothetical protein ACR2HY_09070 [Acidimicrobiales bacterium]
MKDIFGGKPKGRSKEEIEREAQRELDRLTRHAGPRPAMGGGGSGGYGQFGSPSGGLPTPLDEVAKSVGRRPPGASHQRGPMRPDPGFGGGLGPPSFGGPRSRPGAPSPTLGPRDEFLADDEDDEEEESASITEMALRDHAARFGTDPEDLVIRQDPYTAEQMREQAMQKFYDQQQARHRGPETGPADPVSSVLGRLAARRAAEEEAQARADAGGGGVLGRIRAQREAEEAQTQEPPMPAGPGGAATQEAKPRPARTRGAAAQGARLGPAGRLRDQGVPARRGEDRASAVSQLRDRVASHRQEPEPLPRTFARPATEDDDEGDFFDDAGFDREEDTVPVPELEAVVARLSRARVAQARRRAAPSAKARAGGATKSRRPVKAPAKAVKAPAKTARAARVGRTADKAAIKKAVAKPARTTAEAARAKTPAKSVKAPAKAVKAPAKAVTPTRASKAPAKAAKAPAKAVKTPATASNAAARPQAAKKPAKKPAKKATARTTPARSSPSSPRR